MSVGTVLVLTPKWSSDQGDRYARMEAEANEFSGLILIPPPALRKFIPKGDPALAHIPGREAF